MTSRRLFPVLLAVCALVASAMPRAQAQAQAITMPGYPAPGAPTTVTVLAPGAAPRKVLRYAIPAGQKARMDMTMSMDMNMNLMGNPMPMSMPGMKMSIDLAVTGVAPNGDITYDIAFTGVSLDAGADPTMAQMFQSITQGMTSIKGTSTISSRGVTKSTVLDVADPTIKQMMSSMTSTVENLSMPFPEEAVGVGARWEARQATSAGGQTIFQKSVYEVVSIEGQSVSLKVTSEQTAPPQPISNPSFPAGMEVTLDKMSGSGSGTTIIRLDSLVPTSTVESTTSMVMSASMGGQSMPISTDGKVKIVIAPGKDK